MFAPDRRKGRSHLDSLARRYKIPTNTFVDLEYLANKTKYSRDDLIAVYNRYALKPYKKLEKKKPPKTDEILAMVYFAELASKKGADIKIPPKSATHKYKISNFSTKNKRVLEGMTVVERKNTKKEVKREADDDLPEKPPILERQDAIDMNAYKRLYKFIDQLDKHLLKQYRSIPVPKNISMKYIK